MFAVVVRNKKRFFKIHPYTMYNALYTILCIEGILLDIP